MSEIRRTDQGGSIVTFVVIGVILAFLLIGTVYSLKQHSQQVRRDQAIAEFEQQQADKEAARVKALADNSKTTGSAVVKVSSVPLHNDGDANADDLPITGPELVISELIGAGLLAVAVTSYATSRRNITRSL